MDYEIVLKWIIQTLMFDRLICNFDRHWNNFWVIIDGQTDEFTLSPIFDNGVSFFTHNYYNKKYGIESLEDMRDAISNNREGAYFHKIHSGDIDWERYKDYRLRIKLSEVEDWIRNQVTDERVEVVLTETLKK